MKIHSLGAELYRADGRADMPMLIVSFRNWTKALENDHRIAETDLFTISCTKVGKYSSMVLHPAFKPFSPRCHGFEPFEFYDVSVLIPRPTPFLKTWVSVFVQNLAPHLSSMGQPTYERNLLRPIKWGYVHSLGL